MRSAILLVALLPLTLTAQPTRPGQVLFRDDFAGPALDRSHWNVITTGRTVNNEQQAYVDSTEVLRLEAADGATDGALVISPRHREGFTTPEGHRFDFVSGRIESKGKFEFMHGTASARMKLTVGAGLWPAFWILGTGPWPATGEIDVMEHVGETDWTSVAVHGPGYSGNTPLVAKPRMERESGPDAWHVYGVDWTSDAMMFWIDGREVYRATRAMVEKYGEWAFDNDKYLIVNMALGGNYPFSVNKAERPYRGLPASTVELIKQGRAATLVDWVMVERD